MKKITHRPFTRRIGMLAIVASTFSVSNVLAQPQSVTLNNGNTLTVGAFNNGCVRVYVHPQATDMPQLPLYEQTANAKFKKIQRNDSLLVVRTPLMTVKVNKLTGITSFTSNDGLTTLTECGRQVELPLCSQTFYTSPNEFLYGTGQFQDGYLNINGLSRRLTQVNTQIAIPMVISDAGYGILWNNCGMTNFNPAKNIINLQPQGSVGETVVVDATSTEGNKKEERNYQAFVGTLQVPVEGDYTLLLDVGQAMARKHYLAIDGTVATAADNLWLPPTTSVRTHLTAGTHTIEVRAERNDHPTVAWKAVDASTTFESPTAQGVDYTVMMGDADKVVAQMRQMTGEVPKQPRWAFGYVHCRERYHSQDELLRNAREFRQRNIPIDVIVQDWQWWGKNGWNAMEFDHDTYPNPKEMADSVHRMDMRIMLSVWAKVDKSSVLGKELNSKNYFIPQTDWVDFFNPDAANAYWTAYKNRLLPTGIDAWWQDATEPENDDLAGRWVNNGKWSGDMYRNIFPLMVNHTVYNGFMKERPNTRPLILTRSAVTGIQRYGVFTWSGDVGNDWQSFARQIVGGLGQMAAGVPWWTYDAGGFFRPGNQYTDADYQARMLRWIQTSVYLPMMRVHGYISDTEPWRYPAETYNKFVNCIHERYTLFPYIYSEAMAVSTNNATLMRPLVFDFPHDRQALRQDTEFMFGHQMLVCPVTEDEPIKKCYLPTTKGGWYEWHTRRPFKGGCSHTVKLSDQYIPVFVKAGSVVPTLSNPNAQSTTEAANATHLDINVFPGADASFSLFEDDGVSQSNNHSIITFTWNDQQKTLLVEKRKGSFKEMPAVRHFHIVSPDGKSRNVEYNGKAIKIKL